MAEPIEWALIIGGAELALESIGIIGAEAAAVSAVEVGTAATLGEVVGAGVVGLEAAETTAAAVEGASILGEAAAVIVEDSALVAAESGASGASVLGSESAILAENTLEAGEITLEAAMSGGEAAETAATGTNILSKGAGVLRTGGNIVMNAPKGITATASAFTLGDLGLNIIKQKGDLREGIAATVQDIGKALEPVGEGFLEGLIKAAAESPLLTIAGGYLIYINLIKE